MEHLQFTRLARIEDGDLSQQDSVNRAVGQIHLDLMV